jgi:hypothetical protein
MPTNAQKARAGAHFVVAELLRRGAGDITFDDRRRILEIVASNADGTRSVTLRVKTKTVGDWQTTVELGEPREPDEAEDDFWVLVDIHLRRHGGQRPVNPRSTHCAIRPADVEAWRDRWDALGVC